MRDKKLPMYIVSSKQKKYKVKSKLRLGMFIGLLLIIAMTLLIQLSIHFRHDSPATMATINVTEGDTLWSIARSSLPEGRDIRDFIHELREVNQLTGANIITGQQLMIPVYDIQSSHNIPVQGQIAVMKIGVNE